MTREDSFQLKANQHWQRIDRMLNVVMVFLTKSVLREDMTKHKQMIHILGERSVLGNLELRRMGDLCPELRTREINGMKIDRRS